MYIVCSRVFVAFRFTTSAIIIKAQIFEFQFSIDIHVLSFYGLVFPFFFLISFCNNRLTKLAEYYGGFFNVFNVGLIEVRQLFPEPGITSLSSDDSLNITTYPGSQDLYDFIVNSAHQKENMIYL